MNILLRRKMSTDPHGITIGDEIYYLKRDNKFKSGVSDKYFCGCATVTEIFIHGNSKILSGNGTVGLDEVNAVMVSITEENTGDTYKLILNPGEFTYSYKNLVESVYGVKSVREDD